MKKVNKLITAVLIGCLILVFPGVTLGSETMETSNSIELTLDDAVNRALAKNNALKTAEYDIERSEVIRDEAVDDVKYTPVGPTPAAASAAFTGLVTKDLSWQMSKKTKDVTADTVVASVLNNYTGVLAAQEKVAAAEKALAYAEWQRLVARVGYQVGTVSISEKTVAESGYEGKAAALAAARSSLDDCFQKLNTLVGINSEERPVLKDNPECVPLKIDNLETEVSRRIEKNPSVWMAERNIDLAKLTLDLHSWNDPTSVPYDAKKIDVDKAELNASSTKEQMQQLVRTLYYSIREMEEQYVSLEQALKVAEENLRIKQVMFEVGMATKGDLLSAESELANAKQALKSLTYQHELYKYYFNKPWAFSGTSGM